MQIEAYAATDTGPVREHNEDGWFVDIEGGVFAVADGMGGHAAGEVAAQIAIDTVRDVLLGENDPDETVLHVVVENPEAVLLERLRYCMNQASIRIRMEADMRPSYAGMGTTLVVVQVEDTRAYIAHVGDSRAYRFRDARIQRMTRDHTVVQQEVDAGRLTPELARIVPHKNILTKSVGYHGPVDPDTSTASIKDGDLYLLCSDGLSDPLDDSAIAEICRVTHPEDLAQELVDRALAAGGEDNVTVVVLCFSED